jgi:hypothetical protein
LFGIRPVYASYSEGAPRAHHRHGVVRHSYRRVRHKPATS